MFHDGAGNYFAPNGCAGNEVITIVVQFGGLKGVVTGAAQQHGFRMCCNDGQARMYIFTSDLERGDHKRVIAGIASGWFAPGSAC